MGKQMRRIIVPTGCKETTQRRQAVLCPGDIFNTPLLIEAVYMNSGSVRKHRRRHRIKETRGVLARPLAGKRYKRFATTSRRHSKHFKVMQAEKQSTPLLMTLPQPDLEIDVFHPVDVVVNKPLLAHAGSARPQIKKNALRNYHNVAQLRQQGYMAGFVCNFFT